MKHTNKISLLLVFPIALVIAMIHQQVSSLDSLVIGGNFEGELVFADDFSSGLSKWEPTRDSGEYWEIIDGELVANISSGFTITELVPKEEHWNSDWKNFSYSFDITGVSGVDKNVSFHFEDLSNWYEIHFFGSGLEVVRVQDNSVVWSVFDSFSIFNDVTHKIEIVLSEAKVSLYVDETLIFEEIDPTFNGSYGKIGIKASTGAVSPTIVKFDNVEIRLIPPEVGLDLPFSYDPSVDSSKVFLSHTTSIFDHNLPLGFAGDDGNSTVTSYLGIDIDIDLPTGFAHYDQHNGYDFSGRRISDGQVRAPAAGTVIWGYDSTIPYSCKLNGETFQTRSCMAKIDHGDGLETHFLHLASIGGTDRDPICKEESSGQFVQAGEPIGQVGNTGCSTASHIHMEVLKNNIVIDPSGWQGGPGNDPWENHINGAASIELWIFPVPSLESLSGIDGEEGVTLTFSDDTIIDFPSGTISGVWDFNYFDVPVSEPANGLMPTGHSFIFEGLQTASALSPLGNETSAYTITITFTDAEISNIQKDTLRLYWWDEELKTWVDLSTNLDFGAKTAVASVSQFGLFAFLGVLENHQYLPIITR